MRKSTRYPNIFTRNDYKNYSEEETRKLIQALLQAMTLEEKLSLLGGSIEPKDKGKIGNAGYQWGVPRLGIPEGVLYDGPAGVTGIVETTGLPQPSLLGCTWDEEMAYEFGRVAASENAACSGNYQLSPQVDTIHSPHFMRNKDMKSEDSYLVAKFSVAETKATQDQHVIATEKHFAVANHMCGGPGTMWDNRVDEQTLHETYLRPFEDTIKQGGAGSVMNSYNMVNGHYSTDSEELNIEILRNQWGFKGSLMSDWGSVHNFTLNKGMDIEMPVPAYNSPNRIMKHVRKGDLSFEQIDASVEHVLFGLASAGLLGLVQLDEDGLVKEDPKHLEPIQMEWRYEEELANGLEERNQAVAQKILEEGTVLLKNDGVLPLTGAALDPQKTVLIGLGAKYPICGQQQERSYGRLRRMISGSEAMKEVTGKGFDSFVGIDYGGTTIPAEVFYQDEACSKHGVLVQSGILDSDRNLIQEMDLFGGGGAAFIGGVAVDEDGDPINTFVGSWDNKAAVPDNIGEIISVDDRICYTTGTKNYKNGPDGNAFPEGSGSYTLRTWLKAPESGDFVLKLQCIGGEAKFLICIDGIWQQVAQSRTREATQWPWDMVICTETGMGITNKMVTLEKDKVYPILVTAEQSVIKKDLQVALAWNTPSAIKADYENALDAASKAENIIFYAVNANQFDTMFGDLLKDQKDITLASEQKQLLMDIISAKKADSKLIVVLQTSNARAIGEWEADASAIVTAYHGGQEGSRVIVRVLTGDVNPSGKLTQTWPRFSEDTPLTDTEAHYAERLGGKKCNGKTILRASEGIFFGYRWYDKYGIKPLYPFGHGLSYTSYEYSNLSVEESGNTFIASFDVTNTGSIAGDEIVQLYLGEAEVPAYVQMAKKQLAGFTRVKNLQPQETRRVSITVDERCLSYWDIAAAMQTREDGTKDKWQRACGNRKLYIASSVDNIRLEETISVK